ncbi:MAG: 50S ribosomal protein L13 [Bacteroidota bacterium]
MKSGKYVTLSANRSSVTTHWYVVDATEQVVGRMASRLASLLRGKHKVDFTPHVPCGDKIVVLNADKIQWTGKKEENKQYISHTGYPGGQRVTTPAEIRQKDPTLILRRSVRGMLPKNKLRDLLLKNLFIYTGSEHPHDAQAPQSLTF